MNWGQQLLRRVKGPWSNWPAHSYLRERYQKRLAAVQDHLRECLDQAPPGAVRIVSLCAGDGRDVIGVLATHPRRDDVRAWLVERDGDSVAAGIERRRAAGLDDQVVFIQGDATDYATYRDLLPCDIVVVCGVLGHVLPEERSTLVERLRAFCKPRGVVIWVRGVKQGMARYCEFQSLFESHSFERGRETLTAEGQWGICNHAYVGLPCKAPQSGRIFQFRRIGGRD
jgi:hypothetical protein